VEVNARRALAVLVREDAHDIGAAFDPGIEPFDIPETGE
jgi:hypothetical protein